MLTIGLTGGIGSGKTTVANLFAHFGVPIIDADIIARECVRAGSTGLQQIQQHFGASFINNRGELNRTVLREHIFKNESERKKLEAILHPLILHQMKQQQHILLTQKKDPYCLAVMPLLFETAPHPWLDRILLIRADNATRIQRLTLRDKVSTDHIQRIIQTQTQTPSLADDIIDNNGELDSLQQQVEQLHLRYCAMSHCSNI